VAALLGVYREREREREREKEKGVVFLRMRRPLALRIPWGKR
jgi:hypothetical protein